jgi:SAM-dependent methyltransferase
MTDKPAAPGKPMVRTATQLREHYEIEKELAARLRAATKADRRGLYGVVYDERAKRISHHPLVVRSKNKEAQALDSSRQFRLLKSFLNPNTVFLELGSGDCALSLRVAQYVKQVYAVDVSSALVYDNQFPPNFKLCVFDGFELPVGAEEIDLIYSRDVVEHLHPDDLADQMSSACKTLRLGGKYICVTPNRLSGPWDISRHFDHVPTAFHLKEYTSYELVDVFKAAGFSRIDFVLSYFGYHLTPVMPIELIVLLEHLFEHLPWSITHSISNSLTAVKVIATK